MMKLIGKKKDNENEYIAVTPSDNKYVIRSPFSEDMKINGHKKDIKIFENEEGFTFLEFNNKKYLAEITDKTQNKYTVLLNGVSYSFTIESPISYRRRKYLQKYKQASKLEPVIAPMPGKIIELLVEEHASVKEGEAILILEAMKMQNEIIAQVAGKIKSIKVKAGDTVTKDDVLMEIERK
jgi:biotin carboxyl carrier protein